MIETWDPVVEKSRKWLTKILGGTILKATSETLESWAAKKVSS
jgi:hypothetical protein